MLITGSFEFISHNMYKLGLKDHLEAYILNPASSFWASPIILKFDMYLHRFTFGALELHGYGYKPGCNQVFKIGEGQGFLQLK